MISLPAEIIDGSKIADSIMNTLRDSFKEQQDKAGKQARLVLILIGKDEGASTYSRAKIRRGEKLGVRVDLMKPDESISEAELAVEIGQLASDPTVTGIMIENPVPKHLSFSKMTDLIPFYKDIDGTSSTNQGRIVNRQEFLVPATAAAVVRILSNYPELTKSILTIVNRTPVVGRPLSQMLLNRDYTISVCHSKTPDVVIYTRRSDVVISAVGKPNYFDDEMINPDCTFIDVGINYVDGKVTGDANYQSLVKWVKRITPVPGGVGPITATLIFENLLKAFNYQNLNSGKM